MTRSLELKGKQTSTSVVSLKVEAGQPSPG